MVVFLVDINDVVVLGCFDVGVVSVVDLVVVVGEVVTVVEDEVVLNVVTGVDIVDIVDIVDALVDCVVIDVVLSGVVRVIGWVGLVAILDNRLPQKSV